MTENRRTPHRIFSFSFFAYNADVWTHGRKGLDFSLGRGQINSRLSRWTTNATSRPAAFPIFRLHLVRSFAFIVNPIHRNLVAGKKERRSFPMV